MTTTTKVVTLRDTTVVVKPDSAILRALIECDSLGQAKVMSTDISPGERIKTIVNTVRNNEGRTLLEVECHEDSLIRQLQLRDTQIERLEQTVKTVPAELTSWQKTRIYIGDLALLLLLIVAIAFAVKLYLKFNKI